MAQITTSNRPIDTGIFIRADGTRTLSADWDIGAGRSITVDGDYLEVLPVGIVVLTEENDNPATLGIIGTWESV